MKFQADPRRIEVIDDAVADVQRNMTPTQKLQLVFAGRSPADSGHRQQLGRRERMLLLPNCEGFAARPEDVMISKMQYYEEGGSEKHLRDIASMFK